MDEIGEIAGINLAALCDSERCAGLERLDAYHSGRQYDSKKFNWDGNYVQGYADAADVSPGCFVPMRQRRPAFKMELSRLITTRLTAMLLGEDSFPTVSVEGDREAEDYVNALVEESSLKSLVIEARDKGGASGTAVLSFAFIDGKPRIQCHRSRHVHVLKWADRYELRPAVALKAFRYSKNVLIDGVFKKTQVFFVRLWTETSETVWDQIPADLATGNAWVHGVPSYRVDHNYGECPVYWIQNLPDSDQEDGICDTEGLQENFDEINILVSATLKGTIANVDPTLVIRQDPSVNTGSIRKGSENAIYSVGGAEYLELSGTAVDTAKKLADGLIQYCLDVSGVVVADPSTLSGAARSGAAMRLLYQPMVNQCDKLRTQYGQRGVIPILKGMLRAARLADGAEPGPVTVTGDGRRIQERAVVKLEPRMDVSYIDDDGSKTQIVTPAERTPGTSERITLKWPSYFRPTPQDIGVIVDATLKARGVLISPTTATKAIAGLYSVGDVDQELVDIEAEHQLQKMLEAPDMGLMGRDQVAQPGNESDNEGDNEVENEPSY